MIATRTAAVGLIVSLGVVSLFADITYEGARSLAGPFLASLGASGAAVGLIAGAGEFLAYGLRYFFGRLTDRLGRYWTILFCGYAINLASVPLLAFAETWPMAAGLLVLERFGKAVRSPARDALLSYAAERTGRGWGFGLHEALDQTGAVLGPVIVALVLRKTGSYSMAFLLLAIPALCAMLALGFGRTFCASPARSARQVGEPLFAWLPRAFWVYCTAAALMAFGFVDFSLIAYHAKRAQLFSEAAIPTLYAAAMAADAIAALMLGRWYDRAMAPALLTGACLSVLSAPLVFLFGGNPVAVLAGILLWGAGLGAQESVLRAAVAGFVPPERRATAYGAFHALYGVAWFAGSAAIGLLYDLSLTAVVVCSLFAQLVGVVLFARLAQKHTPSN
ncbi:MAG: MFS transporter [Bryobacteraceae bacterium]|nr:MFS transporter [Bryobacteraceae bacterium]MDW8376911.1 MFS transporter [Bryobacterales bacterium]